MLNKPYLSIQEMVEKTEKQRREIQRTLSSGIYHPEDASIFTGQKLEDRHQLYEALHNIPLSEFLAKSSTTGIAGAAYLVPDKIHDAVTEYTGNADKTPLISAHMVTRWEGGSLKVPIFPKGSYVANEYSSGGKIAAEDIGGGTAAQATLTPIGIAVAPLIGSDLIEDMSYDIVDYHFRLAGEAMGAKATDMAIKVLKTATDGAGTAFTAATGDADETKYTGGAGSDVLRAWAAVAEDGEFVADTLLCMPEAWEDSISQTSTATTMDAVAPVRTDEQFDVKLSVLNLDVLFNTSPQLHGPADVLGAAPTDCVSIVFDRARALLTGRKRWLQIENYANPREDLAGCVITSRQDSVTLHNNAIAVLTET